MKIVFFGTSEFGAIILEKLIQAGMSPVLVVTTPDKPAGRKQELTPPPVKVCANTHSIEVFQPEKLDHDAVRFMQEKNPDLFVVAAYGKILPKEILDIPRCGSLNVHPSLLPKYRGASPIQTALLDGEDKTGVTIILMDEKVDHGPVIADTKYQILNTKYTYGELHNKLAQIGAELLIKTIPDWIAGRIKPVPQDENKATYTKIFKKEDGRIDWNKEAEYIERQVRALNPWPGTFTAFKNRSLKILKALVFPENLAKPSYPQLGLAKLSPKLSPKFSSGTVFLTAERKLGIQCGKDALVVEELQMEGGKPMSSKEFLLGHKNFIGTILC